MTKSVWGRTVGYSISVIILVIAMVIACGLEVKAYADDTETVDVDIVSDSNAAGNPSVSYATHVQSYGWLRYVKDGTTSGVTGKAKRIEAFRISETGMSDLGVTYRAYVQGKAWMSWVGDNELGGTVGQAKRVEAFQVKLTGSKADNYDIYYAAHCEKFGWLNWAKNGETAGTQNLSLRIEAIAIKILPKGSAAPAKLGKETKTYQTVTIAYASHVAKEGWQKYVRNGALSGTVGKSRAIQAIVLNETGNKDLAVSYTTHVQGLGWQNWSNTGKISGTVGQNRQVEAIRIKLAGNDASKFDIYYAVQVEKFGWLNWAKNGEVAGTTGLSCRVEAIKIQIVAKNFAAPAKLGTASVSNVQTSINFAAYVNNDNWYGYVGNGATAGKVNGGNPVTGLKMAIMNQAYSGNILYSGYLQDTGWSGYVGNNNLLGDVANAKRIEAVSIKLDGEMAQKFDIYYRVYTEKFGWTGWGVNGQNVGTIKYSYRIEAINVKLVAKGKPAPGSMANTFREFTLPDAVVPNTADGNQIAMFVAAQQYSSPTSYLILVNRTTHRLGIYTGGKDHWNEVFYWACGDGKASTPTVEGVHRVIYKKPYFDSGVARCWWATNFAAGGYHIHSGTYAQTPQPTRLLNGSVGVGISHGCVRLAIDQAKWVYDNIPISSTVVVYHS